jgi:UDP-N-acetylglucosamine--N-acetylmuramyl-(pentapeptide) pyrophosphoryl-undecaprenol N-acetylglucosamine transferase
MVLVEKKAAEILEEKDLDGPKLIQKVENMLKNEQILAEYAKNSKKMAILDANRRIYDLLKTK